MSKELREAAEDALDALEDWDTAWTPSGVDVRQRLRKALGKPEEPVCPECKVDMGGHGNGCTKAQHRR